jgi:hypothetical protein
MTYEDAERVLEKLAAGKCYSIKYDKIVYSFNPDREHTPSFQVTCGVYLDGLNWYNGPTWEIALSKLEAAMHPVKVDEELARHMEPKEDVKGGPANDNGKSKEEESQ